MSAKHHSKSIKINNNNQLSEITLRHHVSRWNDNNSIYILFWNHRHEHDVRRKSERVMTIDFDGLHFDYLYNWTVNDIGIEVARSYLILDGVDFAW